MSTSTARHFLTNATLQWNRYGKQVIFLLTLAMLMAILLVPDMTVLANGATSNAGG